MLLNLVLEKTLESPLDCKEIKSVNPKGNQSWIFIGRTDSQAEAPILWLPDVKNWLNGKNPVAWKDWRQEEKGILEDEIVGWHHRLDGHVFEHNPGVGDGQGSLVCCRPWSHTDSDMTELLNWNEQMQAPILGPSDVKSWVIGQDPEAGKDWGREEKGAIGHGTVVWRHWLIWHEFEQTQGDNEGQRSLECCSSWGHKESDKT